MRRKALQFHRLEIDFGTHFGIILEALSHKSPYFFDIDFCIDFCMHFLQKMAPRIIRRNFDWGALFRLLFATISEG